MSWVCKGSRYAAWLTDGVAERAAVFLPCKECGAPAFGLCYSVTGLPASGPCPGRMNRVERRDAA